MSRLAKTKDCHDKAETERRCAEREITDIATRCISCHPKGKVP
jgi:hypothetical protein